MRPRRRRRRPGHWLLLAVAAAAIAGVLAGAFGLRSRSPSPVISLPDPAPPQEQSLTRAVAAAPADPAPARRLGDFYRDQSRPFEALWAYSFALHARPADALASLGAARALEAALLPDAAIARLREILERQPGQQEAAAELAELSLRTGQPAAALAVIRDAGAAFRQSQDGAVLEGRAREALGDDAGADRAYRRALARNEQAAAVWHRLGLLALSQGQTAAAREALERARSLDPTDPRWAVDLGRMLAAPHTPQGEKQALELFADVVRVQPDAPAFYQAGLVLERQYRLPQAEGAFRRAIAVDTGFAGAHGELARLLARTGRSAEARYQRGLYYSIRDLRARSEREYMAMAAADPAHPDGLLMASRACFKMQQKTRAAALARQAFIRHPDSRAAREEATALAILILDHQSATRWCRDWLRAEPAAPQPFWMLGRIAINERRIQDGIRYYEQALAKDPENPIYLEFLGEALLAEPGTAPAARALPVLSRAAVLAPQDAPTRYQLGLALMRAGRLEEALRQMLRSLDLDPNQAAPYNVVVQLARRLGQPGPVTLFGPLVRDVEERLREELLLWRNTWDQPEDPAGYLALSRFLIRTADPRQAESQLEQALLLRPHWPEAKTDLARVRRLLAVL